MSGHTPEAPEVDEVLEVKPEPTICEKCGGVLDPIMARLRYGTTIDWNAWIPGNYEHRDEPTGPCARKVHVESKFLGE